ncbi:acyl-CoA carboxylase epsilon subunit [Streptomyces chumphonensis]|uniref:acyl-CoA carboxylase epsilon subunit n=1 Tax=Streptomyces chumphonensis TaxID=1214925 RepID=UPI003D74AD22
MADTPGTTGSTAPEPTTRLLDAASWRITRGSPTAEEVAALAVVLSARLRERDALADGAAAGQGGVRWGFVSRPEHPAARSWVHRPLPGWRSAA